MFLNPLQFAPREDLSRYPRTLERDLALCAPGGRRPRLRARTPTRSIPAGEPGVRVSAGPLGDVLEGASRPGHFDGVLTVVAKLLHLTGPDVAYFGQKDAQQLLLIRRMVRDLDFPVEVVAVPTVRDADGLALSSRNIYLTTRDRRGGAHPVAVAAGRRGGGGARAPSAVRRAARAVLVAEPLVRSTTWRWSARRR